MKRLCSEVVDLFLNLGELASTERPFVFHDFDVRQPVNVAYFFSETHDFEIESLGVPWTHCLDMGCSLVEAVKRLPLSRFLECWK